MFVAIDRGAVIEESQVQAAKLWFITRFIHSLASRNFVLRFHGLQPMTPAERQKLSFVRTRNPQFDFEFTPTSVYLVITPITPESEWCRGVVWFDEKEAHFQFRTTGKLDLFTELDIR